MPDFNSGTDPDRLPGTGHGRHKPVDSRGPSVSMFSPSNVLRNLPLLQEQRNGGASLSNTRCADVSSGKRARTIEHWRSQPDV